MARFDDIAFALAAALCALLGLICGQHLLEARTLREGFVWFEGLACCCTAGWFALLALNTENDQ